MLTLTVAAVTLSVNTLALTLGTASLSVNVLKLRDENKLRVL